MNTHALIAYVFLSQLLPRSLFQQLLFLQMTDDVVEAVQCHCNQWPSYRGHQMEMQFSYYGQWRTSFLVCFYSPDNSTLSE